MYIVIFFYCVALTNSNSIIASLTLNPQPQQQGPRQSQVTSSQGSMVSHSMVSLSQDPRSSKVSHSQARMPYQAHSQAQRPSKPSKSSVQKERDRERVERFKISK